MPRIPLAPEYYDRTRYGLANSAFVNMFAEQSFQADRPVVLLQAPGTTLRSNGDAVRGIYARNGVINGNMYVVAGSSLIEYDEATQQATALGSVAGSGQVRFSGSVQKLVIVADTKSYEVSSASGSFAEITDSDFGQASDTDYLDGFHLFTRKDTEELFWADVIDPADPGATLSFNALNFVSAEGTPDNLKGLVVNQQEIYLFGAESIEVFYNTGNADSQFQRLPGAEVDIGTFSAKSKILINNTIFFVGDDSIVYQLQGLQPQAISKPQISEIISNLTDADKALISLWTYTLDGHIFLCMDIPNSSTFVYDLTTSLWHERVTSERNQYEPNCAARFDSNVVVGSRYGGLRNLRTDADTDAAIDASTGTVNESTPIVRTFRAALPVEQRGGPVFNLALDVVTGTITGDTTPQISMRWSDDRGNNFSEWIHRSLGAQGAYSEDVVWTNLGLTDPPMRLFEFRATDTSRLAVEALRYNEDLI